LKIKLMESKKSIWTSITGGITSAAPILLSCCKSGACVGVCTSPIASLFGVSSGTIASSPLVSALEPLLIAISAVSFTVSYYSLYVYQNQIAIQVIHAIVDQLIKKNVKQK